MKNITINNINFLDDYQEVAFSIYENNKLIKQNVAITQLPLSSNSIHTINDKVTELAQTIAELASETKIWKDYDSDKARILRAIDRDFLTEINDEYYTLNACFDNNVSLKAFLTEYNEIVIAAIDSVYRQDEIKYKMFNSFADYENFLESVKRKHNLYVGSCSNAYSLATELGFTKDSENEAKTAI